MRKQINVYLSPEEAPAPARAESVLFSVVFVSMLNIFSITASRTLRPQPTASSSSAPATTLIEEYHYFVDCHKQTFDVNWTNFPVVRY